MKESALRKLLLLLLVIAIINLLWAVGANSRKKVELTKSEALESKLNKLILANTAIVTDLKATRNRLASLQRSKHFLKKNLAIATEKNEVMKKTIEKATSSALGTIKSVEELADEAAVLKNTNITLGEEILNLKKKDAAFKLEIEKLKAQLLQTTEINTPRKKSRRNRQAEKNTPATKSSNKNFTWE